ncbi:N5-carboxyaminoimidazole ribonucleotide synthase [Thalassocella blandensis]|nr:N5-carboxyaminoimidazole ribonucleotide synthase [Thalassocella blandensis]
MSQRIAIIGGGQLARMMALDGIPMGISFSFLVEHGEDTRCVNNLGDIVTRSADQSSQALYEALGQPTVITVEKEHVDIPLLRELQSLCPVYPNPDGLEKFKNRLSEKRFLQSLEIPLAAFQEVTSREELEQAINTLAKPIFLKSQEQGYDGYNQYKITDDNAADVLSSIEFPSQWVAESFVDFQREVSFIAVRSTSNKVRIYPAVENYHHNGTLLTSLAPAPELSDDQIERAKSYLKKIVKAVDYVGVICMECFVCGDDILVNEIAPRVHNSGHWTSKGALTSQFENHVRAVSDLPLGSTEALGISGMLNLLGVTLSAEQACDAHSFLTLYGKTTRPRRKLGHVTVNYNNYDDAITRVKTLEELAYGKDV